MDLLGQVADGRSAREVVDVVGQSRCPLRPRAYGDGPTELVTAGAYRETGALLWVVRGFWRVAPVPTYFGYLTLHSDRLVDGRRELLFAVNSGGSAGDRGFVGIEIADGSAIVKLATVPTGASQMNAQWIDRQQLLVTGRKLPARPWGISSNCCLPGGHEWLWRSTPSGFVLVAERQAQDPYYALNALLGALDAGTPTTAGDVAKRTVIDAASAVFAPVASGAGQLWTYKATVNQNEQSQAELFRWAPLIGDPIRAEPVSYEVSRYDPTHSAPTGPSVVITIERIGEVWIASTLRVGTLP
jgi:hypothetical protein